MHWRRTLSFSGVILNKRRTVVTVVHARMGSSRFPGKMMALLGDHPILEWVLTRSLRISDSDHFVLATSDLPIDDVIADFGRNSGIEVFRGSNDNVLQRVIDASERHQPDAVVRICADNPFIEPNLVSDLVRHFRNNWCDYLFNHRPGLGLTIADGFGAEIFDYSVLRTIEHRFSEPRYREHLTSALWEHTDLFDVRSLLPSPALADDRFRFDVDVLHDLLYLEGLVTRGKITLSSTASEIMEVARAR